MLEYYRTMYNLVLSWYSEQKEKYQPLMTSRYLEFTCGFLNAGIVVCSMLALLININFSPIYCPPNNGFTSEELLYHCMLEGYYYKANGSLYSGTLQIVKETEVGEKMPLDWVLMLPMLVWGYVLLKTGLMGLMHKASNYLVEAAKDMPKQNNAATVQDIDLLVSKFMDQRGGNVWSMLVFHVVEVLLLGSSIGYVFFLDSLFGTSWTAILIYIENIDHVRPHLPDRMACCIKSMSAVPGKFDKQNTMCYLNHNKINRRFLVGFYCGLMLDIILGFVNLLYRICLIFIPGMREMQLQYMTGRDWRSVEAIAKHLSYPDYFVLTNMCLYLPKYVQIRFIVQLAKKL